MDKQLFIVESGVPFPIEPMSSDIVGEVWRPVGGYEGLYAVSNKGRVKSLSRAVTDKVGHSYLIRERYRKPKCKKR
jgi:hypothetical protein